MTPLVSILIPAYNCEAWVGAAIVSALAQTWRNKEVIVFDDGSTDGTLNVIGRFGTDIRIESQRLGGQNAARNHLTQASRGEWLVFLDADDELMPENVERKMEHAGGADVLYGSVEMTRYSGQEKVSSQMHIAVEYADPWWAAFNWSYPNTSAMMFRRSALLEAGGWPLDVANCTDYALYFRLLLRSFRFRAAPGARSLYRHWSTSQASYEDPLRKFVTKIDLLCWAGRELNKRGEFTPTRLQIWSDRTLQCVRLFYPHDPAKAERYLRCILEVNPGYRPAPPEFSSGYSFAVRYLGFRVAQWLADKTQSSRKKWNIGRDLEPHPVMLPNKRA